ncbi:Gfo/Idh/MocA family protein [Nocardioides insulae]|uniref:Gfo/Idh/MocA family protein n=1 Tax=Nocardioides insulae TaxID=394734 RepID=UPI000410E909|nr:Gfo/Idh/MocA family oxidoreductase [Nocardioides insulae]
MTHHKPALRVGMIGYAFMGAAHSQAWRTAPRFFDLPLDPVMSVVCGRDTDRVAAAAEQLGWASSSTSWEEVVAREDIDLVDVCTPGNTHAEIAIAALRAGKHVLCEKPLANTVEEAEEMAAAAEEAARGGTRAMVGFTYRRVPAIGLARRMIAEGRIGEIRHVRAQYLQDWLVDPEAPLSWRLDKKLAGSGALGDIGAHVVDLTQHLVGDTIAEVTGTLSTFVTERPIAASSSGLSASAGTERGPVTVDDATAFLARFEGGYLGVYEATRFATGRKNSIRIEINGTRGSLAFDFEDMNVLEFHDGSIPDCEAGFRRIIVTEADHPWVSAWWPPGHGLGYEHGFTHQVVDLTRAIAAGEQPAPSFADGLQVQRVLAAVEASAEHRRWEAVAG